MCSMNSARPIRHLRGSMAAPGSAYPFQGACWISWAVPLRSDTRPGDGTVFRFDLDLETYAAEDRQSFQSDALEGQTVWVVSERVTSSRLLERYLRVFGADVQLMKQLPKATENTDLSGPSVVIWDYDCWRGHRKRRVGMTAASCHYVMITPERRHDLRNRMGRGCDGYLLNPVRRKSLLTMLSQINCRPDDEDGLSISDGRDGDPSAPPLAAMNILLAEDNDINAMLARSMLMRAGHTVEHVKNGGQAVAAVEASLEKPHRYRTAHSD